jgi:myotubularin-related protein 5/13
VFLRLIRKNRFVFFSIGGHALRFSIGADDRQVIQPPANPTVPCTGLSVYNLFKELGKLIFFCKFMK